MDKWAELRTAYQVAKLGTVSAAANALGFHRATVNRHIDALEEEMGARIFIRHARGYTLTELGEDVLRVAQKTEELIDDLAGRVQGGKAALEGELKLTILAGFAELLMKPISDFIPVARKAGSLYGFQFRRNLNLCVHLSRRNRWDEL